MDACPVPNTACYWKHEEIKRRVYEQRVSKVEHGSLTPLVLSLTGEVGSAAQSGVL